MALWRRLATALVLLCALALPGPLAAQFIPGLGSGSSTETDEPGGDEALGAAIRKAADEGLSVIIVDENGRLISAVAPNAPEAADIASQPMDGPSGLMQAQSRIQRFQDTLMTRLRALPTSIIEVTYILRKTSPDGRISTYVQVLATVLLFLLAAQFLVGELYAKRVLGRVIIPRIMESPQGYRDKMPFLALRFCGGVSVTVITIAVAYIGATLIFGRINDISVQFTVTAILTAYAIIRTVADFWRMVLSPYLPQYRIPTFGDRDARRLYHWLWILVAYDIVTILFSTWIADFGLTYNVYAVIYGTMGLVGAIANIVMVVVHAPAISNAIRGGRSPAHLPWAIRAVSVGWAPFLILFVVIGWVNLAHDLVMEQPIPLPMVAAAYLVLQAIMLVYGAANYLIERYFHPDPLPALPHDDEDAAAHDALAAPETHDTHPPLVVTMSSYEELARRAAGIIAFAAGIFASVQIWRSSSSLLQGHVVETLLDISIVTFVGYILYHAARIWIDGKMAEELGDEPAEAERGDEGGAAASSRLGTLLPLLRGIILSVVFVTILLIVLMELGLNVSPLFAGAGVVGIAVGFGAQTLIRDIFSGAFFLIDDAFRKGEYIDLGDVKGTVEKISVRSMQLRHHLGALNTIPFGEIKVLTNYSRDWVIMKLPLRVTYDTDVEKVRKLIKKLGQELLDDPVIGQNFIDPLKSQGVIEMQDSAMIIRVKFMTKPGDQWLVRKKVYEEIRQLFEREGIHFAHREVTVRLAEGNGDDLTENQKKAVAGAVQRTIEDEEQDDSSGPSDDR
ncbi:mechanosensitive ion channel family protein [Chachezhania antarctica]|uniref:mechanosensitive ion channel family protein n=1 Tax=Chachezhania antarctica TaxID=2340860 RepID=UPI000EB45B7D|nr:mechanosensitive ion channel domain-containing protein [Chachezhania antarctica]